MEEYPDCLRPPSGSNASDAVARRVRPAGLLGFLLCKRLSDDAAADRARGLLEAKDYRAHAAGLAILRGDRERRAPDPAARRRGSHYRWRTAGQLASPGSVKKGGPPPDVRVPACVHVRWYQALGFRRSMTTKRRDLGFAKLFRACDSSPDPGAASARAMAAWGFYTDRSSRSISVKRDSCAPQPSTVPTATAPSFRSRDSMCRSTGTPVPASWIQTVFAVFWQPDWLLRVAPAAEAGPWVRGRWAADCILGEPRPSPRRSAPIHLGPAASERSCAKGMAVDPPGREVTSSALPRETAVKTGMPAIIDIRIRQTGARAVPR